MISDEQYDIQMAGISVAASGSYDGSLRSGDYGWSAPLQDVYNLRKNFEYLMQPIFENDNDFLKKVINRLKGSDGEGWAVGEMVERALKLKKSGLYTTLPEGGSVV